MVSEIGDKCLYTSYFKHTNKDKKKTKKKQTIHPSDTLEKNGLKSTTKIPFIVTLKAILHQDHIGNRWWISGQNQLNLIPWKTYWTIKIYFKENFFSNIEIQEMIGQFNYEEHTHTHTQKKPQS